MSPTMALLHRPAEWVGQAGRRITPLHALVKSTGVGLGLAGSDSGRSLPISLLPKFRFYLGSFSVATGQIVPGL